jgi:hypothetical protein
MGGIWFKFSGLRFEVGSCCVRFKIFRGYYFGGMEDRESLMSETMWRARGWIVTKTRAAAAAAAVPSVWPRMRQVILGALAAFPDARAAVAAAIREFATSENET